MPTARHIQARTRDTVGNPRLETYAEAKRIVAGAGSLKQAVEDGNFLDGLEHRAEALAVLKALPADVDARFMASLRDALEANKKIAFGWRNGEFDHNTTESDGTVTLWLQCPDGRTFLNPA